jgi:uncharacterized phage-associated protein
MPADVNNAFDVAFFFADMALEENEYLQPQKLQRLLFMAQSYYGVAFNRKLMPAIFVADEMGPMEPNIYIAFSRGRPEVDVELFLPHETQVFLERVWRRFGHFTVDQLNDMAKETSAYKKALERGPRAEIKWQEMCESFKQADQTPGVDQVVKPKILRTQSGRPVEVKSWNPGQK